MHYGGQFHLAFAPAYRRANWQLDGTPFPSRPRLVLLPPLWYRPISAGPTALSMCPPTFLSLLACCSKPLTIYPPWGYVQMHKESIPCNSGSKVFCCPKNDIEISGDKVLCTGNISPGKCPAGASSSLSVAALAAIIGGCVFPAVLVIGCLLYRSKRRESALSRQLHENTDLRRGLLEAHTELHEATDEVAALKR